MRLSKEPPYAHGTLLKTGVLLVNLGTPDAPTKKALRRYLGEFLWDARVVEIPRVIWWFILNGIILNVRPKASAEKYATVWTESGSPLRVFTHAQEKMLRESFKTSGYKNIRVESAMRYGSPSVSSKLEEMRADGCDKILVVPMYPQYNSSTTGSVYDAVFAYLSKVRNQPGLRLIKHFHDDSGYIDALAERVVVLISSDLAHTHLANGPYGYSPAAKPFDAAIGRWATDPLAHASALLKEAAGLEAHALSCGFTGLVMLHGALLAEKPRWSPHLLANRAPTYYGMMVATF